MTTMTSCIIFCVQVMCLNLNGISKTSLSLSSLLIKRGRHLSLAARGAKTGLGTASVPVYCVYGECDRLGFRPSRRLMQPLKGIFNINLQC